MDQTLKIRAVFIDFIAWWDAKKQAYEILMLINMRCLLMLASNVQKDNMLWCSLLLPIDQPRRPRFVLEAGKHNCQVLSKAQTLTSRMKNDFLYHYFYFIFFHFPPVSPQHVWALANFLWVRIVNLKRLTRISEADWLATINTWWFICLH